MSIDRQRVEELAALNAVGALDGEDLNEFLRLKEAGGEEVEREIAAFEEVASALGAGHGRMVAPPPLVKQRLMARLNAGQAPAQSAPGLSFIFSDEGEWMPHPVKGILIKQLALDTVRGYATLLMKVPPGTEYPEHHHSGPEECYVLEGDLHAAGRVLGPGDFHHADAGSDHGRLFTKGGCTLLLVVAPSDYLPN
jgi:quercetin dioxygenase-like cupin family protein